MITKFDTAGINSKPINSVRVLLRRFKDRTEVQRLSTVAVARRAVPVIVTFIPTVDITHMLLTPSR